MSKPEKLNAAREKLVNSLDALAAVIALQKSETLLHANSAHRENSFTLGIFLERVKDVTLANSEHEREHALWGSSQAPGVN